MPTRTAAVAVFSIVITLAAVSETGPAPPPPPAAASDVAERAGRASAPQPRRGGRKPDIAERPIPFGAKRKRQTRRYSRRHYGLSTWRLRDPKVIVEHMAATSSYDSVYNTFAANEPDVEFGERPGVCAHFLVGEDGEIWQFVRTGIVCRHTVGLNYTAIGIEHLGQRGGEVLRNSDRRRASLRLTNWLRCRFGIRIRDVIGHNENLSSPYYEEHDPEFRGQTHSDWPERLMDRYRRTLRKRSC